MRFSNEATGGETVKDEAGGNEVIRDEVVKDEAVLTDALYRAVLVLSTT